MWRWTSGETRANVSRETASPRALSPSIRTPLWTVFHARAAPRPHFTRLDQGNQPVEASKADPEMGFMARLLALCSLPRTNPGNRLQFVRRNGPYILVLTAGGLSQLPYGKPSPFIAGLGLH